MAENMCIKGAAPQRRRVVAGRVVRGRGLGLGSPDGRLGDPPESTLSEDACTRGEKGHDDADEGDRLVLESDAHDPSARCQQDHVGEDAEGEERPHLPPARSFVLDADLFFRRGLSGSSLMDFE